MHIFPLIPLEEHLGSSRRCAVLASPEENEELESRCSVRGLFISAVSALSGCTIGRYQATVNGQSRDLERKGLVGSHNGTQLLSVTITTVKISLLTALLRYNTAILSLKVLLTNITADFIRTWCFHWTNEF